MLFFFFSYLFFFLFFFCDFFYLFCIFSGPSTTCVFPSSARYDANLFLIFIFYLLVYQFSLIFYFYSNCVVVKQVRKCEVVWYYLQYIKFWKIRIENLFKCHLPGICFSPSFIWSKVAPLFFRHVFLCSALARDYLLQFPDRNLTFSDLNSIFTDLSLHFFFLFYF